MHRRSTLLLLAAICVGACAGDATADGLVVGAAASLSGLLPDLAAAYERESGQAIATTIGSSGQPAQQIRQGAPIAVFLSADVEWVDALVAEGRIVRDSRAVYARGRLAMWSRDPAAPLTRIEDLALPAVARVAIANPESAPYGRAAREALVAAGVWDAVEPRIVIAENVRQALQFAETGNADVAFVADALVRDAGGRSLLVPASLHAPLDQALGVVAGSDSAGARRFAGFVLGAEGRAILNRHGLTPPSRPYPDDR